MNWEQYTEAFRKTISDLQGAEAVRIMTTIGRDADAIIRNRIINTGQFASGKVYQYKTKPMLTNKSGWINLAGYNQVAGSKQKRNELEWVTLYSGGKRVRLFVLEGGYKRFRMLQGRQGNFVDLSYQNRMWKDIDVLAGKISNVTVTIGAKQDINRKKLEGHGDKYEKVLNLSQNETTALSGRYNRLVAQVFKNNGL